MGALLKEDVQKVKKPILGRTGTSTLALALVSDGTSAIVGVEGFGASVAEVLDAYNLRRHQPVRDVYGKPDNNRALAGRICSSSCHSSPRLTSTAPLLFLAIKRKKRTVNT